MIKHFCDICEKEIKRSAYDSSPHLDDNDKCVMEILGAKELCIACEDIFYYTDWKRELIRHFQPTEAKEAPND